MAYNRKQLATLASYMAQALDGPRQAEKLVAAAAEVVPFTAAICVINRRGQSPIYLYDTYQDTASKDAVQRYVQSTYLLNPVYNAFLRGLTSGVYRMCDLAPDNWASEIETLKADIACDEREEIGYRTLGWPARLEELVLAIELSDGVMGEISFSRPSSKGGFSETHIKNLQPFMPLFKLVLRAIWQDAVRHTRQPQALAVQLEEFARASLTQRENEVIQMVLKGHSSQSIALNLIIALPTVKTHRKNAYAKLGIATQQELFNMFLQWQHTQLELV